MIRVAAIVGPTAAGKTRLSLDVAQRLDGEIVSLDSMQVYRGMDIGTDKLPPGARRGVPHHMIDLFDVSEEVTVSEFQERARAAISDIADRGRLPVLVGGSGLYFRAVVDDLQFPPTSAEVRAALEDAVASEGTEAVYARLQEADPVAAERIDSGNARRIVRALEVIELTGRRFSDNRSWDDYVSRYDLAIAGLQLDREQLRHRVEQRVDEMFARGLLDEAVSMAPAASKTARQALGYRQIFEAAPGDTTAELRDRIVRATRRFARRQEAWFKADPRIKWFDALDPSLAERVVSYFASSLGLALRR